MNDLTAIAIFIASLAATFGLIYACAWLRPREQTRSESATNPRDQEARQ